MNTSTIRLVKELPVMDQGGLPSVSTASVAKQQLSGIEQVHIAEILRVYCSEQPAQEWQAVPMWFFIQKITHQKSEQHNVFALLDALLELHRRELVRLVVLASNTAQYITLTPEFIRMAFVEVSEV